jgi:hypothetical protein
MPVAQAPGQFQALANVSAPGTTEQLGWITTVTNSTQLNLIYTATSCDIPLTLVVRDTTGSFVATTITLTGNSLINYGTSTCGTGSGYVWAPTNQNTIIGLNAGNSNTLTGTSNVAHGFQALQNITTGFNNAAIGFNTLALNTAGSDNTAVGTNALSLTTTKQLTAFGSGALQNNTTGIQNTAVGYQALNANTTGTSNTAIGYQSMKSLGTGFNNTAVGTFAALSLTGSNNTVMGSSTATALTTGTGNIIIGALTAPTLTTGSNNIYIGTNMPAGSATENSAIRIGANYLTAVGSGPTCFIGGIASGPALASSAVRISLVNNQLTVTNSSKRFKTNITGMANGSQNIYQLNPVTFNYFPYLDPTQTTYYGLIAEDVVNFYPSIVPLDGSGLPATVNYDMLAPLLLNEAIKLNTFVPITLNYTTTQNTIIGKNAGSNIITGSNNIYLGYAVTGTGDESNIIRIGTPGSQTACYVAGISGMQAAGGSGVFVASNGQLGTSVSSKRYKEAIEDMGDSTQNLNKLRPVAFSYKADPLAQRTYGLIAEEVQQVYPDIVVYNAQGEPESVQYHLLPTMLLNEYKRDHARIAVLEDKTIELEQKIKGLLSINK